MKKIEIIVCNNGLGHLRRVLILLDKILEQRHDLSIRLYVDKKKLKFFETKNFKHINNKESLIKYVGLSSDINSYENEFNSKFKRNILDSDLVWTDNQIFPLKYKKNIIITGSFLWCEILSSNKNIILERKIFIDSNPIIIGDNYFSTKLVRLSSNFMGVGLLSTLKPFKYNKSSIDRSILVSFGRSNFGMNLYKKYKNSIQRKISYLSKDYSFILEPYIYNDFPSKKNLIMATYSDQMYDSIKAAIIRPGMGTLTECLSNRIKIFSFQDNNFEMKHNSLVLDKMGLGVQLKRPEDAIDEAVEYINNTASKKMFYDKLEKIDFNGILQTTNKILDLL